MIVLILEYFSDVPLEFVFSSLVWRLEASEKSEKLGD